MKQSKNNRFSKFLISRSALFLTIVYLVMTSFASNKLAVSEKADGLYNDINGDGTINILIISSSISINGGSAFSPYGLADELQKILIEDASIDLDINVVAEDIYKSKSVTVGLGGAGTEYTWTHFCHSLVQYYYWPEGRDARMENLSGNGDFDWDYVVIASDPYIISNTPGFYSLGVNKIAAKAEEGGAQPLLLMIWPKNSSSNASIDHFEEFTYRTADGTKVDLQAIPAGLAWEALPEDKKDNSAIHPTPNGAYVAAASIYSHIYDKSASTSDYNFDDELADIAFATKSLAENQIHYSGVRTFVSPFKSCDIGDETINYNHTGTSSENGIRAGLNWVFNQSPKTLQNGGASPIDFNYGRANSNFEANKRYKVDPAQFDFSFGFPMQDHGNHGNVSMLYGIDRRQSGTLNDTDLGVARFMIQESEIPYARAIPIRTLYAQIEEAIPGQSAYRDSWHMHRDLDKAIAAYMYTLLNGTCVVGEEPVDQNSDEWRTWMSHKIGYETAWNLMYLQGDAPDCNTLLDEDGDGFNSVVDCDDNNEMINPNQSEEVYNGIDEDCNPGTPDDDLDADGFLLAEDCNDNDANVNPNQNEEPYNGVDDDCDPMTLDDDLDEDGFLLVEDCNDNDADVNPNQIEEPYNGVDDDCNPGTPDDDLDADGFLLAEDCNDNDANVNPNQNEEPYNGVDDDCDSTTLDDDLDQDGFLLADDCDDENPEINPNAEEIPNNDIDEDCDGMDLVTDTHELANSKITIYPNPATEIININVEGGRLNLELTLYSLEGIQFKKWNNSNQIELETVPSGNYLLEIKDTNSHQRIVEKIVVVR